MSKDIHAVTLDMATMRYHNPEIKYEREAAIRDLLRENKFVIKGANPPPYHLHLGMVEGQLQLHLYDMSNIELCHTLTVSMDPFKRLIKDYFIIWESYSEALKTASPEKLQAVDMGRRAIHDEGASLLQKRLQAEVEVDFPTLRRLFTLICVLHIK